VSADGTLTAVPGSPYLVPGQAPFDEEPESLAAIGNFLYAATANPNTSNGITGFKINSADGSLTMFDPSKGDTGHYFLLVGDAQRGFIYASGNGPNLPGVSAFKVNADGGLTLVGGQVQPVTSVPPGQSGTTTGSLELDPQGRFLFDFFQNKIHVFPRNSDGSLRAEVSGSPFAAGTTYTFSSPNDPNPCFFFALNRVMAVDEAGRFLYSTCDANAEVDEFSISNSGQLTPIGTIPALPQGELSSLAFSHDGSTLFGTQEELNQVVSFSIDRSSGKLTPASTMAAGIRPNSAAVDRSNRFLYATNGSSNHSRNNSHNGSDNMSEYGVTPAGVMTSLAGSPITTGHNPRSVIVVSF
jgi:6-phosphogluconolactonase (cycloisomerase 2 family)